MKDLFNDVLNINGVQGILLLSKDGKVIFDSMANNPVGTNQTFRNWKKLIDVLKNAREADFVFENGRFYLRQTHDGYLLISMQTIASIAMIKLNCDILLPNLKFTKNSKGLKSFFKR
jgi:hypothetical protein